MRLHPGTALVVCLCLWIPVDQSYATFAPEDQDGSGDEEFSGSGSGDDDIWFSEPEVTTPTSPRTTKPSWHINAPVILFERPVTQNVTLDTEPETPGHITEAPYTTQITDTQPSPVIIKSPGSEEDQKGEATIFSDVAQPEITVPPAEKPTVVPTHKEERTTTAYDEYTEESSVTDKEEDEAKVPVGGGTVTTEAPGMETTPMLLRTTSTSNLVDTETSGDSVEFIREDIDVNENIIPEHREPELEKPTMVENEINPGFGRSGSDFARGSASDSDSLLERKEVLAGVIAGGVVGLAFAIMLVALMVYRMKKKDEGSYSLDEHKHPNGGYQKPLKQEEFLA